MHVRIESIVVFTSNFNKHGKMAIMFAASEFLERKIAP